MPTVTRCRGERRRLLRGNGRDGAGRKADGIDDEVIGVLRFHVGARPDSGSEHRAIVGNREERRSMRPSKRTTNAVAR